ncbi:SGNH/GDSL hydrolase family protein [Pedobacter montanisoli]|uniref:SGNH/GDSL hydrolase family protein n=1 Tax=Pedobacter montanisoli TaxID=2923277 RepID=A0ABS9ZSL6_9SPHI|nr:SGNH/GDSL hydrolase family protein [Pedobacter montanisoli]MCJ0741357.1 SGNH/GDSL hydrolase family protein [Pedobacter montanisoli]
MAIPSALSYLALGDSYTIGEAVEQQDSFPYQLVKLLNGEGLHVKQPEVIAQTGWTTDELMSAIKERNLSQTFDIVTLLIGVNNQYRGYTTENYRKEFDMLLATACNFADAHKKRVFVISIPDWGVTDFGKQSGRDVQQIAHEIDTFNHIKEEITRLNGVTYIDITPISRKALTDARLTASDGLHPSAEMYAEWVKEIAPKVKANLNS